MASSTLKYDLERVFGPQWRDEFRELPNDTAASAARVDGDLNRF
jgi:hypothetical protein